METVASASAVRERVAAWRAAGDRVAFVPTMGNLHAGHISLIKLARKRADRFVASIFVNPMQFGPNEDFAHYPRTPQSDADMLERAGCDLMFMPDVAEIYPAEQIHATRVEVPGMSSILCGEFRPGHFEGVATVVAKLFNIVQPDIAVFGEKDFQQLTIIRRMTRDLCFAIEIVGAPTVRESDGLAMSSRNQYLTPEERAIVPVIYATLERAAEEVGQGTLAIDAIERQAHEALVARGLKPDYFSVRRRDDLLPPRDEDRELVILTAARLGKARLIDNVQVDRE